MQLMCINEDIINQKIKQDNIETNKTVFDKES